MKSDLFFAGHQVELHAERFLWIPALRLMCVSDLHLEKGSFFSRFATLLPPYDSQEIIAKLTLLIEKFRPAIFIALGDSFHDQHGGERLDPQLKSQLNALIAQVPEWIWIMGNHDPDIHSSIHGKREEESLLHTILFRHALKPQDKDFEISGHFHPKISVRVKGHTMSGACFVKSGNRLIMPSFGGYTGGLSIRSAEFLQSLPEPVKAVFMSYGGKMHRIPLSMM